VAYQKIDRNNIRHYKITVLGDRKLPSVTTILGLLSKPALIAWSANVGVDYIKENLIDKILKGEVSLEELKEIDTSEIVRQAKKYHKEKKEQAANIGSKVHHAIQKFLVAKDGEQVEVDEDIKKPFYAFLDWFESNKVEPIPEFIEYTVWSEEGYAGTEDLVAYVNGKLYLIDFKTSKAIYPEMVMQIAAYFYAFKERVPFLEPEVGGILRLDKETGFPEFNEYEVAELEINQKKFLYLVKYWHLDKEKE